MTTTKRRTTDATAFAICALVLLALSLFHPADVRAQWTTPDASQNINNTNTGNVGIGTTAPDSLITVNANTSGLQAPGPNFAGTLFHLSGANNSKVRFLFDAFGSGFMPQLTYRFARGTSAAPSAVQAGDTLGQVTASGYKATGYTQGSAAVISFLATENWNDTASGTAISFATNVNGLTTSVAERMRIDNSGNVGIGTATPGAKLDVVGTIRGGNADTNIGNHPSYGTTYSAFWRQGANYSLLTDGTNTFLNAPLSTGNIYFRSANTDRMFLNGSTGNVGIGTTTPSAKLDVAGQIRSSTGFTFPDGTVQTTAATGSASSGWTGGGANVSLTNPSANVGIGTSTPAAKLHIVGANGPGDATMSPAPVALQVTGGVGGNGNWDASPGGVGGAISFTGGTGGAPSAGYVTALGGKGGSISLTGGTGGPNVFNVGGGAGGDVFINGGAGVANSPGNVVLGNVGGKVGIGTPSPSSKLHVATGSAQSVDGIIVASSDGHFALNAPSLGQGSYNGITQAGDTGIIYSNGSLGTGGFVIAPWASATSGLRMNANGNVGIGTASPDPAYKLDVVGSVRVSGNIAAKYQDVAEWVESSQNLPAGTVVVLDHTKSNQVIASTEAYDTRVAGVISAQPGITLGESGAAKVLVATTGRVRIKADATRAPIQVGDLLVTGEREGFAMKSLPVNIGGVQLHRPGTLVGKALEPLAKGTGEILVLLSLQ